MSEYFVMEIYDGDRRIASKEFIEFPSMDEIEGALRFYGSDCYVTVSKAYALLPFA